MEELIVHCTKEQVLDLALDHAVQQEYDGQIVWALPEWWSSLYKASGGRIELWQ